MGGVRTGTGRERGAGGRGEIWDRGGAGAQVGGAGKRGGGRGWRKVAGIHAPAAARARAAGVRTIPQLQSARREPGAAGSAPDPPPGDVWGPKPGAGARPGTGKAGVGVCRAGPPQAGQPELGVCWGNLAGALITPAMPLRGSGRPFPWMGSHVGNWDKFARSRIFSTPTGNHVEHLEPN